MNEDELRSWVHEQLGRRVPDSIWQLVKLDGYLNVVDDGERDDLLKRVTQLLQVFSSQPMRRRRQRMTPSGEAPLKTVLTAYERDRAAALSEYYGKVAATMPEVRRFRREGLKGKLLTKPEVSEFLASSAARMLSAEKFHELGIPLVHTSKLLSEDYVRGQHYNARLRVTPPGIETAVEYDLQSGESFWEGVPGHHVLKVRIDGTLRETTAFSGSLFDQLRLAGDRLNGIPWKPGEATWFIMTGEAPRFSPMSSNIRMSFGSFGGHGKVKLEIEPWISAPTVAAVYARAQRQILGKHNRPVSARRLALFRFVNESADDNLEIPAWRGLMERWNKKHKTWHYDDVRNFSRDFWAARRLLTFPDFIHFLKTTGVAK